VALLLRPARNKAMSQDFVNVVHDKISGPYLFNSIVENDAEMMLSALDCVRVEASGSERQCEM
jgi:hypothetical protein